MIYLIPFAEIVREHAYDAPQPWQWKVIMLGKRNRGRHHQHASETVDLSCVGSHVSLICMFEIDFYHDVALEEN